MLNNFFDKIYVLNLHKRKDRLNLTKKRLHFSDIDFEVFNGVDGSVMKKLWENFKETNHYFSNPNYIACSLSHLSIYQDALENGYNRILILEDDNRVHRNIHSIFTSNFLKELENTPLVEQSDILYFGYIPLSDDCSRWDYSVFSSQYLTEHTFIAKNLWGLYAYSPSVQLMKELIEVYNTEFPMEIDRYFVTHIQPRNKCIGISPQLFAADDGLSDNSGRYETDMLIRSVDSRFSTVLDYV